MKALVGAFNQEKALVGAFSMIVQPVVEPMDRFAALVNILVAVFSHSQRPPAFSETEIEMNHYIVKIRESR